MDDSPLINKIIPNTSQHIDECVKVDFIILSKQFLIKYLLNEIITK